MIKQIAKNINETIKETVTNVFVLTSRVIISHIIDIGMVRLNASVAVRLVVRKQPLNQQNYMTLRITGTNLQAHKSSIRHK